MSAQLEFIIGALLGVGALLSAGALLGLAGALLGLAVALCVDSVLRWWL